MSEDAPAKQVNGECLATGRGKVWGLGPEPLLDARGQVDVKTDVHGMFLSSRAGRLGFGHDPRWDEVGQPAAGREEAAEHQVQRNFVRRRFDLGDPGLARPDPFGQVIELVLVRGEVEQVLTPVGNPLPWMLGPEPGQVPFEGAQGMLPQVRLLLDGHGTPSPTFLTDPIKIPRSPFYREISLNESS